MITQKISMKLILIGLLSQIDFSHSRAVNISNTWTLPQAGFNVFYRYFRDKISWFEADAVCQFHHANLVTVENIEQFDATRLFLKELNIPDFVWIGLMRPSNTDQFSWTNSKPLPVSEGYWAEPWPVSETPLCAVIDPSRDYRWHALRCGGPETAAFLCEMEIPDWALHCTANPDFTVQYISDSGAVQISRRCKDSLRELSCQPKHTQIELMNALKCPEDDDASTTVETATENTVEASKIVSTTAAAETTTADEAQPKVIMKNPQKMMEDIFDAIDMNVEVDSNRLDESAQQKMDLDLMLGDQPAADVEVVERKEEKLQALKKEEPEKPKTEAKTTEEKPKQPEEPMMGDAPEEQHSTTTIAVTTERQRRDASADESSTASDVSSPSTTETTTADEAMSEMSTTDAPSTEVATSTATEESTTKIIVHGHPLHMSQAIFKEPIQPDINNTHERIDIGDAEDRFIPPMLLVKAKFTTTTSSGEVITTKSDLSTVDATASSTTEEGEGESASESTSESASEATSTVAAAAASESNEIPTNDTAVTQVENTIGTEVAASERPILIGKRHDPRLGLSATTTTTTTTVAPISDAPATSEATATSEEGSTVAEETSSGVSESTFEVTSDSPLSSSPAVSSTVMVTDESDASSSTVSELATTTLQTQAGTAEKLVELSTTTTVVASTPPIVVVKKSPVTATSAPSTTTAMRNDIPALDGEEDEEEGDDGGEDRHQHIDNSFSNAENFQPYKPNRHRSLAKLDHHHGPGFSIGKILG